MALDFTIDLELSIVMKEGEALPKRLKEMTVQEAGRLGGKARAKKYSARPGGAALGGWPQGRPRRRRAK